MSLALVLAAAGAAGKAPTEKPGAPALTAQPAPAPCIVVGAGSTNVLAEGKPASRLCDSQCATAVAGSRDVLVNGRPALTIGAKVACANGITGVVVGGATSVYVNGKPLAGADARIVGCD
jgi:uncharacterized Zn-binding protein involved in type VI secretion